MIHIFRHSLIFAIIASLFLSGCVSSNKEEAIILAVILPGSVLDQDYNALALTAIKELQNNKVFVRYLENISVSNCTKFANEYIEGGSNVVWLHGGQYLNPGLALAKQNPKTIFILETDSKPVDSPANVWFIDRNFPMSFYILGRIAAICSESGKIGYLTGLNLPFTFGEVHALEQSIADSGAKVELYPVWVGDMNDTALAELGAQQLIDEGVDVIIASINLGISGAVKSILETERVILFTSKYTDKSNLAPDRYITSALYDFNIPIMKILENIMNGNRSGYILMDLNSGISIQVPTQNTPPGLDELLIKIQDDILTDRIRVIQDFSPID